MKHRKKKKGLTAKQKKLPYIYNRKWRDPKEAKKVLKKEKHKEFVDIFDSRFRQHKNSNKLKDGDIALADVAVDKSFSKLSALIYYKGKLVGIGKNGLETYPVDSGKFFF